jgi:hypothetical protein
MLPLTEIAKTTIQVAFIAPSNAPLLSTFWTMRWRRNELLLAIEDWRNFLVERTIGIADIESGFTPVIGALHVHGIAVYQAQSRRYA